MKNIFLIAALVAFLAGCNQGQSTIDQSSLCTYSTDVQASKCAEGQLSFFSPDSWGNEQLPLIVASTYCDFNHPVMYNNSGVVCVFTKQRLQVGGKKQ